MKNYTIIKTSEIVKVRDELAQAYIEDDMLYVGMMLNRLDTLFYQSDNNKDKIQADIRNKLSPPLNLASMVERGVGENSDRHKELVLSEARKTGEVVKYLSNLITKEEYE